MPQAAWQASPCSPSDQVWIEKELIPTVQQRGAAVIEARRSSSAVSAANAALNHMRDGALGTPAANWVSMAVVSDGSSGVPDGLISGFPCTTAISDWWIDLDLDAFSRDQIDASVGQLGEERDAVAELGLIQNRERASIPEKVRRPRRVRMLDRPVGRLLQLGEQDPDDRHGGRIGQCGRDAGRDLLRRVAQAGHRNARGDRRGQVDGSRVLLPDL